MVDGLKPSISEMRWPATRQKSPERCRTNLVKAPTIPASSIRHQPACMIATCILAGSENATSSGYFFVPFTSRRARTPGRTVERWITRPWEMVTNFSLTAAQSPGAAAGAT